MWCLAYNIVLNIQFKISFVEPLKVPGLIWAMKYKDSSGEAEAGRSLECESSLVDIASASLARVTF